MGSSAARGLTPLGFKLVGVITALSVAHHVDHIVRGVTGWPFDGGFNAFSGSLLVYPVIAMGVALAKRHKVGPAFWMTLAGGGALFIAVVHVGPAAGDDVAHIAEQYESRLGGVVALAVLGVLFVALIAHFVHELRRQMRART